MKLPKIVSLGEWEDALAKLRDEEKALTRAGDALAARRRRLPMARIEKDYVFEGPNGSATLLDLFEGRRQLIVYHFMFGPDQEEGCRGCSMMVDDMSHPAHLHARDVTLALVSRAPLEKIRPFEQRMGWSLPWYSSFGSPFNRDFGRTTDEGEHFGLSVFLRDGQAIFRTWFTERRGLEALGPVFSLLDVTPFGRQEDWEDSPEGRPQTPRYVWWRHHDRYDP